MSPLLVIVAVWVLTVVALGMVAWFLYRRAQQDRGRRPSSRHPVFRRKPAWLRNPARELPKQFARRFINEMPAEDLNGIFYRIVERNFPEAADVDAHFDRLVNEVVPDTAVDGEDPQ